MRAPLSLREGGMDDLLSDPDGAGMTCYLAGKENSSSLFVRQQVSESVIHLAEGQGAEIERSNRLAL